MCSFAHGEHEIGTEAGFLVEPPMPEGPAIVRRSICKFFLTGSCREPEGMCTFAHGEHEIGTVAGAAVDVHVPDGPVRRTMCKFWSEGSCRKAPGECGFAHGEHEIGTLAGELIMPPRQQAPRDHLPAAFRQPRHLSEAGRGDGAVGGEARRTICKFWLEGSCRKEQGMCGFAHGDEEIGTVPGPQFPVHYEGPPSRHRGPVGAREEEGEAVLRRTLCKFWLSDKGCNKETCTFAHGEDEIGTVVEAAPSAGRSTQFKWGDRGGGGGQEQPQGTVRRTMCKFFLENNCRNGALECPFAHGDEEIGTVYTGPAPRGDVGESRPRTGERPPCKFFGGPGGCRKGPECPFTHDEEPAAKRPRYSQS